MNNQNQSEPGIDWGALAKTESEILQGEVNDYSVARKAVYDMCYLGAALKLPINYHSKYVENKDFGLAIDVVIPQPLFKRAEWIIKEKGNLWPKTTILNLDKAYIKYLTQDYYEALKTLSKCDFGNISGTVFELITKILYQIGLYQAGVKFCQKKLKQFDGKIDFTAGLNKRGSGKHNFYKLTRHLDIVTNNPPELLTDKQPFNPAEEYLNFLENYGEQVISEERLTVNPNIETDELIQKAHNFHSLHLMPIALLFYRSYLKKNKTDYDNWFYAGCAYKAMAKFDLAKGFLKKVKEGSEFYGETLLALGSIYLRERDFVAAEKILVGTLELGGFVAQRGSIYLGFCREEQGDYRSALNYYEKLEDANYLKMKDILIEILETRLI